MWQNRWSLLKAMWKHTCQEHATLSYGKEKENKISLVYLDWNPEHFFSASPRKQAFLGKFRGRKAALTPDPFAYPWSSRTSLCSKPSRGELHHSHMKSGNSWQGDWGQGNRLSEVVLPFPAPLPPSRLSLGRHPGNKAPVLVRVTDSPLKRCRKLWTWAPFWIT